MSVDPRSRRPADTDDEQEISLGRYWQAVVARWWLVLAGIVAGIVIGYLTTIGEGRTYTAEAIAYLGTPLSPGSNGQVVVNVPTQLALVNETARAESTIRAVAAKTGLRLAQLRGHVKTQAVVGPSSAKAGTPVPIASVQVTGTAPRKVAAAATLIAQRIIDAQSEYVSVKIAQLKARQQYVLARLDTVRARLANAQTLQQRLLTAKNLDLTTQLITVQTYTSLILASESRIADLEQTQFSLNQLLSLAQDIERGRLVTPAVSTSVVARSRANSMIVGAIIGLLLGIVGALLWEPLLRRAGAKPA